jgi:hypothetical protein
MLRLLGRHLGVVKCMRLVKVICSQKGIQNRYWDFKAANQCDSRHLRPEFEAMLRLDKESTSSRSKTVLVGIISTIACMRLRSP